MRPISDPVPDLLATLAIMTGVLGLTSAVKVALMRQASAVMQRGTFGLACIAFLLSLASLHRNRRRRLRQPMIAFVLATGAIITGLVSFVIH